MSDADEPRAINDLPVYTREEQEAFIAENGFGNLVPDSDFLASRDGWTKGGTA